MSCAGVGFPCEEQRADAARQLVSLGGVERST